MPYDLFISYYCKDNVFNQIQIKEKIEAEYLEFAKEELKFFSDKNEKKFGDKWRHSITDGILGSNRVLSFLSKHSTRNPGVCRDEIAIGVKCCKFLK